MPCTQAGPRGIRNLNLTARLADPTYQPNVSCWLPWPKAATDKFLLIPKQKRPAVRVHRGLRTPGSGSGSRGSVGAAASFACMRCRIACDSIHPGIFDGEARPAYVCIAQPGPAKRIARTMGDRDGCSGDGDGGGDGDKVMERCPVPLAPSRFNPRRPTVINPARRGALLCDPTRASTSISTGPRWSALAALGIIRRAIPSMMEGGG